jgi:glutathione synthase
MRIAFLVGELAQQQPTWGGLYLAWAAYRREHEVCFVSDHALSFLDNGQILATTVRVRAGDYPRPIDYHHALLSPDAVREEDALTGFDVVFLRHNPLRDPAILPASPIVDFCWRLRAGGTFVVNDPEGVYRAYGRLYLSDLPVTARARSLVSRMPDKIKAFLDELSGPAILKPLSRGGREKVFRIRSRRSKNLNAIISAITKDGYALAQEYIPEAEQGEKRLLLLQGAPLRIGHDVAIYRRLPALSGTPKHTHKPERCDYGPAEERLVELVRPRLLADGLYYVTMDIAGDKILEINAFSPGGLHTLREFFHLDAAAIIIAHLERRVRLRAAYHNTQDAADII